MYLHWTFSVATLDVIFPRLLLAIHRYSPLSTRFTLVIVNCLLPSKKLILPVVFKGDPFLLHDIVGAGFPASLQDKVTFSPSVFVWTSG